ncbi:MAG: hypothetical protein ACRDQ7_08015 [Haloechinothrix sp.]
MTDRSLFQQPLSMWNDAELQTALAVVAERLLQLQEAVPGREYLCRPLPGTSGLYASLHAFAASVAEERDRRHRLYQAVRDVVGS